MSLQFDIDKIVGYLEKYKDDLPKLYKWNAKIDGLVKLDTLEERQVKELNKLTPFERELHLKKIVGQKLRDTLNSNPNLFDELSLWVIKEWGGIRAAKNEKTTALVRIFLKENRIKFTRIASLSKVLAFMYPDRYIIYDSRVAYAINWIILSENAGLKHFPVPLGRNSKMSAFDMNVLIRIKNMQHYLPVNRKDLGNRKFISNVDKHLFIDDDDAYMGLVALVKQINQILWMGDVEKEQNLYFTEMLLFSIADREVYADITKRFEVILHKNSE